MSLESRAITRSKSLFNEKLANFSSHRDRDLEDKILHRVAEIAALPIKAPSRDYDALIHEAQALQINMGLTPKPIVFIENASEADYHLENANKSWQTPWRQAAYKQMMEAVDVLSAKDEFHNTGYYARLWTTTEMAVRQNLPELGLSQYLRSKTSTRLATTAQAIIIEEVFGRPTEPYFATARQRAYIIGMGSNPEIMRIYTPR